MAQHLERVNFLSVQKFLIESLNQLLFLDSLPLFSGGLSEEHLATVEMFVVGNRLRASKGQSVRHEFLRRFRLVQFCSFVLHKAV